MGKDDPFFTNAEKGVLGLIGSFGCFALLIVLTVFGLGAWGFVELINWVTSK